MSKCKHLYFTIVFLGIFLLESGFLVIGHRGNPNKFPEETIQSDNSAFNDGADFVELDLHLSKDNILVISHDRNLSRITGSSVIVSQNNFSYLHTLKCKNGEPIMSLNELFEYYQHKPRTKFLIETKKTSHNTPKNMEQILTNVIKKYHMENRVMFHSFSAPSLETLSKLLPKIPRIFIVGSLKRINFEVLSYVNGINISADLITQNPDLIQQLHKLHKKVYVWAEMDESPKLWNWLINNDIDAVVTNFPATAYRYNMAKKKTHKFSINKDAIFYSRASERVFENPYFKTKTNKKIHFSQNIHVSNAVETSSGTYYQIGAKQFIDADFVNFNLPVNCIYPYWNLPIITKYNQTTNTYVHPKYTANVEKFLKPNTKYKIYGISQNQKWLLTTSGWVPAKEILYYGIFPNTAEFRYYQKLPHNYQQINLALVPDVAFNRQYVVNFWKQCKILNNIKDF